MPEDTIYALATGAVRAAVAIIRLSGPAALEIFRAFTGIEPRARYAHYVRLSDPDTLELLDRGLALWFPAPHSFTGEDCVEFHLHGGRAVVDAALGALGRRGGLRAAEAGEFARRAFAHGKMDLSQIEALADLIDAQTTFQRRQALRVTGGALRLQVERWRDSLIRASALLAAELDFSDEGDVESLAPAALAHALAEPIAEMTEILRQTPASERLNHGFLALILGPPNAGKSTLLNCLARRDVAIVSDAPGTTRDMIEVQLDLEGAPVTLVDTAGLRDAADVVEQIGVARTRARAGEADLLLWLSEGGQTPPPQLGAGDVELLQVATKSDQLPAAPGLLAVSARTGQGVAQLCEAIGARARSALGDGSSALIIRERHRAAIASAKQFLETAVTPGKPLELVAEDIRLASNALGRITGAIDVETILDEVFSRFCIGK